MDAIGLIVVAENRMGRRFSKKDFRALMLILSRYMESGDEKSYD